MHLGRCFCFCFLLLTQCGLGNVLNLFSIAVTGVEGRRQLHQSRVIGLGQLGVDTNMVGQLTSKDPQKDIVQGLAQWPVDIFVIRFGIQIGSLGDRKVGRIEFLGNCCRACGNWCSRLCRFWFGWLFWKFCRLRKQTSRSFVSD